MVKNREKSRLSSFTPTLIPVRAGGLLKGVFISLLLLLCTFIACYFHLALGMESVYTHLFYIPIVLAGLWWGIKTLLISSFLFLILLASHLISGIEAPLTHDLIRGAMFLFVASVLGMAVDEKNKVHAEVLAERNGKIKEMENHAKYVEKVAHELRNPLQVLMGALDTVDFEKLNAGQRELVEMFKEATEEMGKHIKELTEREGE